MIRFVIIVRNTFICLNITLLTMLGCLNPNLGQMWTNPNVGLKI